MIPSIPSAANPVGGRVGVRKPVTIVQVELCAAPWPEHQIPLGTDQSRDVVSRDGHRLEIAIGRLGAEPIADVEEEHVATDARFETGPLGEEELLAPEPTDGLLGDRDVVHVEERMTANLPPPDRVA